MAAPSDCTSGEPAAAGRSTSSAGRARRSRPSRPSTGPPSTVARRLRRPAPCRVGPLWWTAATSSTSASRRTSCRLLCSSGALSG